MKKLLKTLARVLPGNGLRISLLRVCGYRIGKDAYIAEGLVIAEILEDRGNIVIGDRASIGPRVTLLSASDPNLSRIRPYVTTKRGKVIIREDAWIGAGAIILPNVTIGRGAVVGAGAVVTKNVEPYSVVVGVPAKVIKRLKKP